METKISVAASRHAETSVMVEQALLAIHVYTATLSDHHLCVRAKSALPTLARVARGVGCLGFVASDCSAPEK